jgi:hypothetical protein
LHPCFVVKNYLVTDFKMVPGNAEAVMFLIIIPLLILFCLLLEITFDGPSKNLSNDFC